MIELSKLNFSKSNGLIPCIVQDINTDVVIMLGYMNTEAITKSQKEKRVTFYSRTKQRLWTKGETSGNYLELVGMTADCDQDTLLLKVKPHGPSCHTGADTCFNEKNERKGIEFLERIIIDRKKNPKSGSYTNSLFDSGINKIAQKVGEQPVELVIEAKDNNKELFMNEAADLLYHYTVLLVAKGVKMEEVEKILRLRHHGNGKPATDSK
jgi:phosphoribosyl-ATP pyrophosphohydrolase/phosphoribosyl-AMP cyclohydrolase